MINFDMVETGKRIRELRKSLNMWQQDLGEKVGIGQSTIAAYELGKANPSLEVIVKLAVVLETTTDYLLGLTDF